MNFKISTTNFNNIPKLSFRANDNMLSNPEKENTLEKTPETDVLKCLSVI